MTLNFGLSIENAVNFGIDCINFYFSSKKILFCKWKNDIISISVV